MRDILNEVAEENEKEPLEAVKKRSREMQRRTETIATDILRMNLLRCQVPVDLSEWDTPPYHLTLGTLVEQLCSKVLATLVTASKLKAGEFARLGDDPHAMRSKLGIDWDQPTLLEDACAVARIIGGLASHEWSKEFVKSSAGNTTAVFRRLGIDAVSELPNESLLAVFEILAGPALGNLQWLIDSAIDGAAFLKLTKIDLVGKHGRSDRAACHMMSVVKCMRLAEEHLSDKHWVADLQDTSQTPGSSIVTDNLNTQDTNLVHTILVPNTVDAGNLESRQPLLPDAAKMAIETAIPSKDAEALVFGAMAVEVADILTEYMEVFTPLRSLCPRRAAHRHQDEVNHKTKIVSIYSPGSAG
jgi:hypothetical protein